MCYEQSFDQNALKNLREEQLQTEKVRKRKKVLEGIKHASIRAFEHLPFCPIYFTTLSKGFKID